MTIQVTALDHVNLRAPRAQFDRLRAFYRDVVGLRDGPRPDFGNEGAWLYAGDRPVVHLSVAAAGTPAPGDAAPGGPAAPGTIDHVAFKALDPEGAAHALRSHGVDFRVSRSAVTRQHQYFFVDPAGNGVELNFPYGD
jgi:catechol 2,3-dioxygenase-like lactoylglutathione lyase family enzyme